MLNGKIVLITGATSGIGKETAIGLAKLGATIVMTARNETLGKETKYEIIQKTGNKDIEVFYCDLASFESIRNFCTDFKTKYNQLNILINNAGIWDFKRKESKDGIENTFATNYLAPFLMTNLLLDLIQKSKPSMIINLSGLHYGKINFDYIGVKHSFSGFKTYSQSKLAIMLFTRILAKKLEGKGVTVNCANPGMSKTNLGRDAGIFFRKMFEILGKDPKKGAETTIYLASSQEVENITGEYFVNKKIKKLSRELYNMDLANKLWDISTKYVKL